MNKEFLSHLYSTVLSTSVAASTLRNMGPTGTVDAARKGLDALSKDDALKRILRAKSQATFATALDQATRIVQTNLLQGHQHWGTSRKVINIFLRSLAYNRHLYDCLRMERIEKWFEVPLDSHVAKKLKEYDDSLPKWNSVKRLNAETSQDYQIVATRCASEQGILRVDLDAYFYRAEPRSGLNSAIIHNVKD
ncbi:hypothetical protein [Herbaspirillum rubrisubalbicans]|nr:hypothetical protein [Herbaspirillum rubrisubalbicans]